MQSITKLCLTLSLPLMLAAASCGDADNDGDHNEAIGDSTEARLDNAGNNMGLNRDEEFVEDLMEMNTKTIALLTAGTTKGTDAQLKKDAQTMLTDHKALDDRLRALASSKGYELDDMGDEDSTADAADDKAGRSWDDDWADDIADRHKKMVDKLEDYADDTKDSDIQAFINEARPKLAGHASMSEALAKRLDD